MISVTVAAQGKTKRLYGGHLKAYGSGRLSIFDLDKSQVPVQKQHNSNAWSRLFGKLYEILCLLLNACFPFICTFLSAKPAGKSLPEVEEARRLLLKGIREDVPVIPTPVQGVPEEDLAQIFSYLDIRSILACERVCKRWRKVIDEHIQELPKIQKDQIRMLFDEGEVVVYPVDEKRCPSKYPMPSLQQLSRKLRHLRCLSLFVRGLIPVESTPVIKALLDLGLRPQQIYLIWCKFSPQSFPMLAEFLHANVDSLVDLGLEECFPSGLINDAFISPVVSGLTSLRVWNDGKGGNFGITDVTITSLARAVREGSCLETLDLASCPLTVEGVASLVLAWAHSAPSDLTLSVNYCPQVTLHRLLPRLAASGIFLNGGKLHRHGHCLTLFV